MSPKYSHGGYGGRPFMDAWSWLCSGGRANPNGDLWQENVLHAALSTGATTFLWWRPGAQHPEDLGMSLMCRA